MLAFRVPEERRVCGPGVSASRVTSGYISLTSASLWPAELGRKLPPSGSAWWLLRLSARCADSCARSTAGRKESNWTTSLRCYMRARCGQLSCGYGTTENATMTHTEIFLRHSSLWWLPLVTEPTLPPESAELAMGLRPKSRVHLRRCVSGPSFPTEGLGQNSSHCQAGSHTSTSLANPQNANVFVFFCSVC